MKRSEAREIIMKVGGDKLPEAALMVLNDLVELLGASRDVGALVSALWTVNAATASDVTALARLLGVCAEMQAYEAPEEWVEDERDAAGREAFRAATTAERDMAEGMEELRRALLGQNPVESHVDAK